MKKIFLFTLSSCCLFSPFAYGGYPQHTEFFHIGVEDGLSSGNITSIAQDSLGFIWIGTKYGLNRYDGASFKVYSGGRSSLPGNDISVLHTDSKSRLWVGTVGEGLFLYNPLSDSFERIPLGKDSGAAYTEVHALLEGTDGMLWVATEAGLYSYSAASKQAKHYQQKSSNPGESGQNDLRAMAEAPDGKLWLGTFGAGLYIFDTKAQTFESFSAAGFSGAAINADYINALFADKSNRLLVGANGGGLMLVDFRKKKAARYPAGAACDEHAIIRCIRQDRQGALWIGTDGAGILHVEDPWGQSPVIRSYRNSRKTPGSLSCNTVNTFFTDRQSNLWIGTAKKGVNLIKKEPDEIESYYSDGKGEHKLPILSVFHDKRGLWMGTDGEGMTLIRILVRDNTDTQLIGLKMA